MSSSQRIEQTAAVARDIQTEIRGKLIDLLHNGYVVTEVVDAASFDRLVQQSLNRQNLQERVVGQETQILLQQVVLAKLACALEKILTRPLDPEYQALAREHARTVLEIYRRSPSELAHPETPA